MGPRARPERALAGVVLVSCTIAVLLALPLEAQPRKQVVVGSATVMRAVATGETFAWISPFSVFERGRYRSAISIVESSSREPSILTHVKDFWLYHRGVLVGRVRVRQIDAFTGCYSPIGGFGDVRWFRSPDFSKGKKDELPLDARNQWVLTGVQKEARRLVVQTLWMDAVHPNIPVPHFRMDRHLDRLDRGLGADGLKRFNRLARQQLELVQRRRPRHHPLVVTGKIGVEDAVFLDIDRDGTREVAAEFSAPVRPSTRRISKSEPVFLLLMVVRQRSQGPPEILLSLPTVLDEASPPGAHYFSEARDLNGDGVAELVVKRSMYVGERRDVFELHSGRFVRVLEGTYEGC